MASYPLRALLILFLVSTVRVADVSAQPGGEEPVNLEVLHPSGTAQLVFEGNLLGGVPFTLVPEGPLFGLSEIATAAGVELTIGPLGDSHRLVFKEKEILVGPQRAVAVVASRETGRQEDLITFSRAPFRGAGGLKVPLDFLELVIGEELSLGFTWDADTLTLEVRRREIRHLRVSVDVIHQHSSTVEIRFSERPRYRVERPQGAIDIILQGDRLEQPIDTSRATSPLVRRVRTASDRIRIELAEGAGVAEPRLLEGGEARLVVEVFNQAAPRAASTAAEALLEGDDSGVRIIVIDPGHGGPETGAVGPSGTMEKDLALTVSRSLERLLERRLPVRVVLTRDGDAELPLETRTALANQNKADLFISIHFNSSFGRQAHGAETFFLSRQASDQLSADLAAAENLANGGGGDPEADLQLILWDLAQSYHLAESQRFASLVQEELNLTLGLRNRGVKQAPFRVLMGATMPAVLVELGFVSNPKEEARLQDPAYQSKLVRSLFRAVRRFKTQIEAQERLDAEEDATTDTGRQEGRP